MPDSTPDPTSADAPVPGRGQRRIAEVGLQRLKASRLLQGCAIVSFMGYGGLVALVLAGRLPFPQAGVVAALSLASWFFLFWLVSGIQQTVDRLGEEARRTPVRHTLEATAIGCVVFVHVLMTVIVVYSARR